MVVVGDRLEIESHLCTVRFKGIIPQWPNEIAYGVEWDDARRGRHSGCFNDAKYFDTRQPDAGSFMRESKLLRTMTARKTFIEALDEIYGCTKGTPVNNIYIGSKEVKKLGFEELNKRNRDYQNLKVISLNKRSIYSLVTKGKDDTRTLKSCSNTTNLDLGYNIFVNISEICSILKLFNNVEELNLSGNRFSEEDYRDNELSNCTFPHIKRLYLTNCLLTEIQLQNIVKLFPSLEFLDLSWNALRISQINNLKYPDSLITLVLCGNLLRNIPNNVKNGNIKNLDLSQNQIGCVGFHFDDYYKNIEFLDISRNNIKSWDLIDKFNLYFPNLVSVKINGNYVTEEKDNNTEESFYEALARFDKLSVLNGSEINDILRKNAELYFISKILKGTIIYDKNLQRWNSLKHKYNIDDNGHQKSEIKKSYFQGRIIRLEIVDIKTNFSFSLEALGSYTVRTLKGVICSKLSYCVLEVQLVRYIDDKTKDILSKDFSRLQDCYIENGTRIFVYT